MGEHRCIEGQIQGRRGRCRCVVFNADRVPGVWMLRTNSTPDAGAGGLSVANQIYRRFKASGLALKEADIVILDAAEYHYYQVSARDCTHIFSQNSHDFISAAWMVSSAWNGVHG